MRPFQSIQLLIHFFWPLLWLAAPTPVFAGNGAIKAAPLVPFVKARGTGFLLGDAPYRFVGTNLWYAMNLGASGPQGDRPRLIRELDRLMAIGVTNLRVMAASEGPDSEPWRITPALQKSPGRFDPDLFAGLDFLLDEMAKRRMVAVMCLGNFWPWSGGMAQYLNWAGAGPIPYPPPSEGGSWSRYQTYTAQFYSNEAAIQAHERTIRVIVGRVNTINGRAYAEDPTIMAWELANEPRGDKNTASFGRWLERVALLLKDLDPHHLVTTGSEGETTSPSSAGVDFVANHRSPAIDYATAHVWAQNWGWFDPKRPDATYAGAIKQMKVYLRDHIRKSREKLGKPLVFEEFGLARDEGSFEPEAPTHWRDRYFKEFLAEALNPAGGMGAAGAGFWAWAGEGRPGRPAGANWRPGDTFVGDPPHEPQGWYGIYDTDSSTQNVIRAATMRAAISPKPGVASR
jgi:mannan endo-1,4-beta-mannosidase